MKTKPTAKAADELIPARGDVFIRSALTGRVTKIVGNVGTSPDARPLALVLAEINQQLAPRGEILCAATTAPARFVTPSTPTKRR